MASNLPPLTGDPSVDLAERGSRPPLTGDPTKDLSQPRQMAQPGLGAGLLAAKALPYIGAPLGVLLTPGGERAALETARTTIPIAVGAATGGLSVPAQSLAQMGTTYAMQKTGLEEPNWFQVALSGALPFVPGLVGRLWRGGERTATRIMPSRFEAAQGKAAEAAGKMVAGVRPTTTASELAEAAGTAAAASGQRIPIPTAARMIEKTRMLPETIDPGLAPFEKAVSNLKVLGRELDLRDLEELRQQLGPFVSRNAKVKGLYGALVTDLEAAAKSGVPGATAARQAADAFKRQLGANLLEELVTKASPARLISGANVPALNVATFANAVARNKTELTRTLGPDGMKQIERFIYEYRNLPPDVAYNAVNRAISGLASITGGVVGFGTGGPLLAPVGAALGAILPEYLTNVIKAGANPPAVNAVLNALASGARTGVATSGDLVRSTERR